MGQSKLTVAFKKLRKLGYTAKQNFWCCQNCAWHAMTDEEAKKAVFYHNQDNADKLKGLPFHLAWSGDGNEIVDVLRAEGIQVKWSGTTKTRIQLSHYN